MKVTRRDLPLYIEAVASIDGYINADIRARVRGYLRSQSYKDGSSVKAGALLFTIDAAEYSAAASSAKASLERAKVAEARNKTELTRDLGLFKNGTLSQQDLDNAKAAVDDSTAQIQAAEASLDQANLNLGYTQIRSPIDGVAGVAQVRVGNLVGQDGPTLLTTVSQTQPVRVTFPLSEVDYVKYPERFRNLDARDLAWAKAQFAKLESGGTADGGDSGVELVLADGHVYPHKGVVVSLNRQIDPTTGTIQVQALVPDPDGLLRPGQFARVRVRREHEGKNVLAVPEKALVAVQGTYSLAVVLPDDKVQLRRVELGPSAEGLRVVTQGLTEGDRIVVDGTQRATDGAKVDPHPMAEAKEAK
jgi:membrane fusion protein (multidrug efflux system)